MEKLARPASPNSRLHPVSLGLGAILLAICAVLVVFKYNKIQARPTFGKVFKRKGNLPRDIKPKTIERHMNLKF